MKGVYTSVLTHNNLMWPLRKVGGVCYVIGVQRARADKSLCLNLTSSARAPNGMIDLRPVNNDIMPSRHVWRTHHTARATARHAPSTTIPLLVSARHVQRSNKRGRRRPRDNTRVGEVGAGTGYLLPARVCLLFMCVCGSWEGSETWYQANELRNDSSRGVTMAVVAVEVWEYSLAD